MLKFLIDPEDAVIENQQQQSTDDSVPSCSIETPVHLCEVCGMNSRLYKCPRCALSSCSLSCCKQHKLERSCTGQRDRTEFVAIREFKEAHLRNDFHFLEDVLQTKDSARRTLKNSCGGIRPNERGGGGSGEDGNSSKKSHKKNRGGVKPPVSLPTSISLAVGIQANQTLDMHPPAVKKLAKAAESRGTSLLILSPGMSRRTQNTTLYRWKTDEIMWRLHVVFIAGGLGAVNASALFRPELGCASEGALSTMPIASASSSSSSSSLSPSASVHSGGGGCLVGVVRNLVSENIPLEDILSSFLDPRADNAAQRHALRSLRLQRDRLCCLLQVIPSPANDPIFIEVPFSSSLKAALRHKTVIEHPVIFIGTVDDTRHLRRRIATDSLENTSASTIGAASDESLFEAAGSSSHSFGAKRSVDEELMCIEEEGGEGDQNHRKKIKILETKESDQQQMFGVEEKIEVDAENKEEGEDKDEEEVSEEGEDDEEEEEEDFMKALIEMEGKDLETLKAIIASSAVDAK